MPSDALSGSPSSLFPSLLLSLLSHFATLRLILPSIFSALRSNLSSSFCNTRTPLPTLVVDSRPARGPPSSSSTSAPRPDLPIKIVPRHLPGRRRSLADARECTLAAGDAVESDGVIENSREPAALVTPGVNANDSADGTVTASASNTTPERVAILPRCSPPTTAEASIFALPPRPKVAFEYLP